MKFEFSNFARQYAGLLAVLALLITIFSLSTNNFFQFQTLITIANSNPDLIFVSVGMTLVLIVGGIVVMIVLAIVLPIMSLNDLSA